MDAPRFLTKRDFVVESLRNDILNGRLAPETQLMQEEIAARLAVSPTPVREAFSVLEAEGFLRNRPHRGVVVTRRNYAELIDLFEIRLALESMALERVAAQGNDDDLVALEQTVEAAGQMFKSGRVANLRAAATEFHATLVAASGSETFIDTLRPLIARSQFYFPYSAKRTAQSQREHKRIIDALRLHDAATAKRILAEHMNVNIELLRKAARDAAKPSTTGESASKKAGTIRLGARKVRQ